MVDYTYTFSYIHEAPESTHIYIVYWGWGSDPSNVRPYLENFVQGIGGTAWLNTVSQYVNGSYTNFLNNTGMLAGEYSDPSAAPTYVSGNWSSYSTLLGQEALKAKAYFPTYSYYDNPPMIFIIALPPNHWSYGISCSAHGSTTDSNGNTAYWVALPYVPEAGSGCGGGLASVSINAGHEIAETITDPQPYTGYHGPSAGTYFYEVADQCPWSQYRTTIATPYGSFPVQGLWSNAKGSSNPDIACVYSYP